MIKMTKKSKMLNSKVWLKTPKSGTMIAKSTSENVHNLTCHI